MKKSMLSILALILSSSVYAVDFNTDAGLFSASYNDSTMTIDGSTISQTAITGNMEAKCDGFMASCTNDVASVTSVGDMAITNSQINQSVITGNLSANCTGINCRAANTIGVVRAGR